MTQTLTEKSTTAPSRKNKAERIGERPPFDRGALVIFPARRETVASRLARILPVLGALVYPALVAAVYVSGRLAHAAPGPVSSIAVAASLLAVFGVPVYGFTEALRLARGTQPTVAEHRLRALCHLVAATPPLFGAFGVVFSMLGWPGGDYLAWAVAWLAVSAYAYRVSGDARRFIPSDRPHPRLRVAHGISAAALIVAFIAIHLGNHLTAIWSLELHSAILTALRHWYRNVLIEPLIVGLMLFQIGSGLTLLYGRLDRPSDLYRAVQTATGAYLAVYIAAHMSAVFLLGRLFLGIDTGTSYVFFKDGYMPSLFNVRFISHYGLGAFAVITHAGCGLRDILLAHGVALTASNRTFWCVLATGAAVGMVIALALCAVRIAPA